MIKANFITAGRAIFTLSVPHAFVTKVGCCDRYTFLVKQKPKSEKWPEAYFVNLLSGPDNMSDYQPLGKLNPETGAVRLVSTTKMTDNSWAVRLIRRVFARLWSNEFKAIEDAGFELRHAGRCGRCGRVLTVPESIDSGLGPVCMNKI